MFFRFFIPHLPGEGCQILSELFSSSSASSASSASSPAASSSQSRSQWAQPDLHREWDLELNRELQIAVGTAGPQPRLPGRSGHCRTSTATSRSQRALPDLNGKARKNVRKNVRRYARQNVRRYARKNVRRYVR